MYTRKVIMREYILKYVSMQDDYVYMQESYVCIQDHYVYMYTYMYMHAR